MNTKWTLTVMVHRVSRFSLNHQIESFSFEYFTFLYRFIVNHFLDNNMIVEQQIASNENSKRTNLLEMPIEILEQILIHLQANEMLRASHVCKVFASAVETAFARKFSKRYYIVFNPDKSERAFHKTIFNKYGDKIRKLEFEDVDESLLDLIEQKCCNLEEASLICVPKLVSLKGLKKAMLFRIDNLNRETFTEFINNNLQLESLNLSQIDVDLVDVLDGRLNMLKNLWFRPITTKGLSRDLPKIRLNSLDILKLNMRDTEHYARLLEAMNCNNIKELYLEQYMDTDDDDRMINEICSFETLASLQLTHCPIYEDQMRKLAHRLPHLTDLSLKLVETGFDTVDHILSVLSIFPKLSKLTISLDGMDFRTFKDKVYESVYDFYARIATTNTEIDIIKNDSKVSISKDRVFIVEDNSLELHWMENLNETDVRKMLDKQWGWINYLKFVNNCSEQTFDISALVPERFSRLGYLELKSNGPVTVNANVSEIFYRCSEELVFICQLHKIFQASRDAKFFPELTKLKIQLEEHTAIDLFQNLDKNFCKRIEKIELNTKELPQNQQLFISALKKFENLSTLYLVPSSVNFDVRDLILECRNLKDLRIQRQ